MELRHENYDRALGKIMLDDDENVLIPVLMTIPVFIYLSFKLIFSRRAETRTLKYDNKVMLSS
uniref:Uncharacterized protein n=1 Tax=Amphimedon queenslandica TaxID=400682 RepID=A0A1X7SD94_AMPQE